MTSIFIFIMPHFSTQKFMKDRVENLYFMLYHWYVLRNFSKNNLINFSIQILAIKIRITIIIVYFQNTILAYSKIWVNLCLLQCGLDESLKSCLSINYAAKLFLAPRLFILFTEHNEKPCKVNCWILTEYPCYEIT